MPIYKGSTEVTSGNLYKGSTKIENGYKATDSFYVNELAITGLAFSSSSIGSSGGNTNFVVTGANNATYTLSGSGGATAPGGTHTISGSSDTQVISIGSNLGNCAPSRTPSVSVTPTGASVFSPTNLPNADTISQSASPNCVPAVTISGTTSALAVTGTSASGNLTSNTPCNWSGSGGSASNTSNFTWTLGASSTCGASTSGTVSASPISSSFVGNSVGISVTSTNTYGPWYQTCAPTNFSLVNTGSFPNPSVYRINACSPPDVSCMEIGVTWFADTTGAPGSGNVTLQYVLSKSGCPTITRTRTSTRSSNTQLNIECYVSGTVTCTLI